MDTLHTLGDRYDIESTLGRGGMATVYRGRDRVLDRPVAIKVLAERYAGDEQFVTRFKREARAAAGLNHTNIVAVFDTGDTDGRHYIVMEMVEGETLAELLKREGPLSPDRAARIAGTVARALASAHDNGLIHRDVKPGNVMLTSDGDVKVMDFGIARAATDDTLTQTGMVLGTASYLSPEQSRGDPVDHRSDVYSLGCVLYEMLTGRPPFEGDTPVGVAYKHVHEQPDPPSSLNREIPPEVEAVVMRALAKDPDARYATAEAFREALTAAVAGESTEPLVESTAVLPSADAASTQVLSHRPPAGGWLPVALIGALVLIAGIVVWALTGDQDTGRRPERQSPAAQRTQPPESPTVEPTVDPSVISISSAFLDLQELTTQGIQSGLVDEKTGEEILKESQKAIDEYEKGKVDKVDEHLGHAEEKIQEALLEGTMTEETATPLAISIGNLRAAMLAGQTSDAAAEGDEGDED
jgi:serine/threonine-protein kinase